MAPELDVDTCPAEVSEFQRLKPDGTDGRSSGQGTANGGRAKASYFTRIQYRPESGSTRISRSSCRHSDRPRDPERDRNVVAVSRRFILIGAWMGCGNGVGSSIVVREHVACTITGPVRLGSSHGPVEHEL